MSIDLHKISDVGIHFAIKVYDCELSHGNLKQV